MSVNFPSQPEHVCQHFKVSSTQTHLSICNVTWVSEATPSPVTWLWLLKMAVHLKKMLLWHTTHYTKLLISMMLSVTQTSDGVFSQGICSTWK